jgi:hypothetical protein
VIKGEIPLILGMTFLRSMKPAIDFGASTVCIGHERLVVVALG